MVKVFIKCCVLFAIEAAALVAVFVFLFMGKTQAVVMSVIGATVAGALCGPSDEERRQLAEFIKRHK